MDPPWFKEYEEFGIPESLEPYPEKPVHSFLDEAADKYGDMGVVQPGVEMKYPEVKEHADRLATVLKKRGVEKGDRIATILPTSIQFVVSDYAISKAGAVNVPNDFLESEEKLRYRIKSAEPKALIGIDQERELIMDLKEKLDIENLILTKIEDYSKSEPDYESLEGVEWYLNLIENTPPDPPRIDFDIREDLKALIFTGGTTGRPKGCMISHRNIIANSLQNVASMGEFSDLVRGSAYILNGLPLYHAYGYSLMHTLLHLATGQLLVPDPRDTEGMVNMIEEYEALMQIGVPTQFMELLDEELEEIDIFGISGSAPLASETMKEFKNKALGITQGYGLSEMSPVTHFDTRGVYEAITEESSEEDMDIPTIGIPVPDTEVKVLDVETDDPLTWKDMVEEEKEGEMCLKGPQRMVGYWEKEINGYDEEGYVHTGDVVRIDGKGRFYVVDRIKDMINVSGLKVYSEEVDDALQKHSAVKRGATIGIPNPEIPGSEKVKVFVELENSYGDFGKDEIIEHLENEVAQYALPSEVEFMDEIPLTPVGKVDKKALRRKGKERD